MFGLDKSPFMIEFAKKQPGADRVNWMAGAVEDPELFGPSEFSTILCLYFTIYYLDRRAFFSNAFKWLKPQGVLVLHIVDPKKFDPTLDVASPFPAFSIQKYSKQRVTGTSIVFNKMEYESKFIMNDDDYLAKFQEVFTDKEGVFRRTQIHQLHMPPENVIVAEAEKSGLKLIGKTDMVRCEFEYQYLLYFQKKERS